MKKLIVSVFTLATLGFATSGVFAQQKQQPQEQSQQQERSQKDKNMDKTEVSETELPNEVREGWANSHYQNSKVEKIYKIKGSDSATGSAIGTDSKEYYEYVIVTPTGKTAVHVDSKGKILKEQTEL